MISFRDVSFWHHGTAGHEDLVLEGASFDVEAGEAAALIGPSGSGKSTLLAIAAGLLPAWGGRLTGQVLVAGRPAASLSAGERAGLVGYFPQSPADSFLHTTVRAECGFTAENLGWNPAQIAAAVDEALCRFGIASLAPRSPQELSGGEQALVVLAALWVVKPRVLFVDEPLAHLDPLHAEKVCQTLAALKHEGCAILMAEHRVDLLGALPDRRYIVDEKRLRPLADSPPGAVTHPGEAVSTPYAIPEDDDSRRVLVTLLSLTARRGGRDLFEPLTQDWRAGELVVIEGPNGVGKSSLLRALARLDGAPPGTLKTKGRIRYVPQEPLEQLCRESVEQEANLDLKFRRPKVGTVERTRLRDEVLAAANLSEDEKKSPFLLSEGGKRRLAAACGVLSGAEILLLDEPTAGLDPASARALVELVHALIRNGHLVVCATHDPVWRTLPRARRVELVRLPASSESGRPSIIPAPPVRPFAVTRLLCFAVALSGIAVPVPLYGSTLELLALSLSYLPRRLGEFLKFARTLALFWVVPGLILWLMLGPAAALSGVIRLGLLSFVFHRCFLGVDGKAFSIELARWGVPYAVGFSMTTAIAQVPVWSARIARIYQTLKLRLRQRPHRRPSFRVLPYLLVPVVVQIWTRAADLAMSLDLRGFQGKPPRKS